MPSEARGTVVPETEVDPEMTPDESGVKAESDADVEDQVSPSEAEAEARDAAATEAAEAERTDDPEAGEGETEVEAESPGGEAPDAEADEAPSGAGASATPLASGDSVAAALAAVAGARTAFRSVVASTVEDVRAFMRSRTTPPEGRAERAAVELGRMGPAHIDPERFSALFGEEEVLDPLSLKVVEEAGRVLGEVAEAGDELYRKSVEPRGDLHGTVASGLAEAGRAFGAARAVNLVRKGAYHPDDDWTLLHPLPFRRWSRAEREVAPPMVIRTAGRDLVAGGLAEFLDGAVKLVLVVDGPAPLAPLARLVTPGVFVLQTSDAAELERLADVEGPAIAALLPQGAVRFCFDPRKGDGVARGLELDELPESLDPTPGLALSVAQQARDLAWLRDLIRFRDGVPAPDSAPAAGGDEGEAAGTDLEAPPAGSPADRLAAWLLKQADL